MNITVIISLVVVIIAFVGSLHLYLSDAPDVLPSVPERQKETRLPRYKGPKTDGRINRMLAESVSLLKELGVPISDSIAPEVVLISARSRFGSCCPKGSRKMYTDYDYYIEISGFTVNNSEKSLRNTLIHELIHTVPGGLCHTGEWRKWARYVSERTEYHIQRVGGGDDTDKDLRNLRWGNA